ncbi:MAG: hypothetical protein IKB16_12530 [Lentisphaeria bacterium]|nr:hypothetical protein [Lentisphaeria bacterium]
MCALSFGVQLIEGKILSEIKKLIDGKVSAVFLASVLPSPDPDGKDKLSIKAELTVRIPELTLDYTAFSAGETRRLLTIPAEDRIIPLHTTLNAKRPGTMSGSTELTLQLNQLLLDLEISGIEFKQMMMGIGALAHGIKAKLEISGKGTATWQI